MTYRVSSLRSHLLLGALLAAALALAAHGLPPSLAAPALYLLPALLLLFALARRRYPGEQVLLALSASARHRRRGFQRSRSAARKARPRAALPRGGRLIAFSLAVRPPPALAAVSLVN